MMAIETSKDSFRMTLIGALFFISGGITKIICPEMVTIEQGNNAIVSCNITGKEIVSVYWYTGDPAFKSPILRLENGKLGGTEYGSPHYNISSNGAMVINNATILHESVYTVLIYFSDRTRDSRHIKINITISPLPSCPVIDVCAPCEDCRLAVNDTGKLTCSISGVRPVIPLKWVIETENGVNIIEHPPVVETDPSSDTWHTSIKISYAFSLCGQQAELQCEAQDRLMILKNFKSSVSIYKANCTDDKIVHSAAINTKFIILMSVGIVVVVTASVIFMTCLFIIRRRNNSKRRKGHDQLHCDEGTPLNPQKAIPDDAQVLISHLKSKYKASEFFNRLISRMPIEEIELYPECHCSVKLTNGKVSVTSTDKLHTPRGILNKDRVLIAGSPHYWKTIFIKNLVQKWTQSIEIENFILLYISKEKVNVNMKLINFLQEEMSIEKRLLVKGLETFNCILIFDDLSRIVFNDDSHNEETMKDSTQLQSEENSYGNQSIYNLTLLELFKEPEKTGCFNIQIWINSWNMVAINSIFPWPYVTVHTDYVDKEQFEDFMEKICVTFFDSSGQVERKGKVLDNSISKRDNKSSRNVDDCENEKMNKQSKCTHDIAMQNKDLSTKEHDNLTQEFSKQISKKEETEVKDCCGKTDTFQNIIETQHIYEDFKKTPILLSWITHIIIEYLSETCNTNDVESTTKEEIIYRLIDSLQRAYFVKHKKEDTPKISNAVTTMGKLALRVIQQQENRFAVPGNSIDTCIGIGFLQYSKSVPETNQPEKPSSNCVEFSHVYFAYYFAAIFIVQSKQSYTKALSQFHVHESRQSVLKFLIHMEKSPTKHFFEAVREFGIDDDVIDCIAQWGNHDEVKPLMVELHGNDIQVTRLHNTKHREAFASFCRMCSDTKVTITSLTIDGGFSASFLASLQLPINETLTICNVDIEEEEFHDILRCLSEKQIVLRFLNCKFPETWTDEFKRNIKSFESIKLHTIREDDDKGKPVLSFNYVTVAWETKQKPVGTIVASKLTSAFKIMKKAVDYVDNLE